MPKPYGFTAKGKIEYWIRNQEPGTRFTAAQIWHTVLRYSVSRSTITSHLRDFAANGFIRKSDVMRGRNAEWIVTYKPRSRSARTERLHNLTPKL